MITILKYSGSHLWRALASAGVVATIGGVIYALAVWASTEASASDLSSWVKAATIVTFFLVLLLVSRTCVGATSPGATKTSLLSSPIGEHSSTRRS